MKTGTEGGKTAEAPTVYLEDLEFNPASGKSSTPKKDQTKKKCGVFDANQVDPILKATYKGLPPLPRYVDTKWFGPSF